MGGKRELQQKQSSPKKLLLPILIIILCGAAVAAAVWKWNGGTVLGSSKNEGSDTNSVGAQAVLESPTAEAETVVPEEMKEPTVVITDKKQASYEEWLAAGMVVAVSMEYPEFELKGIYLTGETDLADKLTSGGAYVVFDVDGTEQAVYGFPLDEERTEKGTIDLYTMDLGFAAFEPVEVQSIDTAACWQVGMDDLEELIAQSLLVSLYER